MRKPRDIDGGGAEGEGFSKRATRSDKDAWQMLAGWDNGLLKMGCDGWYRWGGGSEAVGSEHVRGGAKEPHGWRSNRPRYRYVAKRFNRGDILELNLKHVTVDMSAIPR